MHYLSTLLYDFNFSFDYLFRILITNLKNDFYKFTLNDVYATCKIIYVNILELLFKMLGPACKLSD
jgi:hypothetical protein